MEYGCERRNENFNEEVHVLFCTFTPLIFYELCGSRNFILDPVPVFWGLEEPQLGIGFGIFKRRAIQSICSMNCNVRYRLMVLKNYWTDRIF